MAAGDLCVLDDVKRWISPGGQSAEADPLLARLITAVSADIKTATGRQLLTGTYTETLNGKGGTTLFLRERPVTAITALTIDGTGVAVSTGTTVAGWVLGGDQRSLYLRGGTFSRGIQNVSVTYTGGYATVPADLVDCAVRTVAHRFVGQRWIAQNRRTVGNDTTEFDRSPWPKEALEILGRYTLRVAA